MNEAETRAEYIDPALKAAGWGIVAGSRIRMEFPISKGRLIGHGQRSKPDKADFVLQYRNRSLAIIEAKKRDLHYTEGVAQAKDYAGKKILIVNTASKCGYTPQYEGLEELSKKYQDKLVIVGFPANNFGGQEPGTNTEIVEFCKKNYGVTFPMAAKISVKGDDTAPIYKWLCNKSENGVLDATIKWNFNKFLLDENGKLLYYFDSKVTPMSDELVSKL